MAERPGLRRRRGRPEIERWLPLAYFGLVVIVATALLPTVLRPPAQQPSSSAELSPDAPPDKDNQSIISALNRAASGTAGSNVLPGAAASGAAGAAGGSAAATRSVPRSCPHGFGNPPRQFESIYAPPCAAAWSGDNGGATYKGVTANQINIGFLMELTGVTDDGPIPATGNGTEGAVRRTYIVWQRYFNDRYQLYGRRLQFFYAGSCGNSDTNENETCRAQKADDTYHTFAVQHETQPASLHELVRRRLVTFSLAQLPSSVFAASQPYLWSLTPDATKLIRLGAEYACKKLAGKPPTYTSDPSFAKAPRKFGILAYDLPDYRSNAPEMARQLSELCGVHVDKTVFYTYESGRTQDLATAIVQLKAAGVTTIVYLGDLLAASVFTQAADSNAYYPEWFLPGYGGVDTSDSLARAYSQNQWQHAFGFSLYEVPRRTQEEECYKAYHEVDPAHDPDDGMCRYMWGWVVQLIGGIQQAGPKLTPQTYRQGLLGQGVSTPNPFWRMAGGYTPSNFTYPLYAAEIWWDPNAPGPDDNTGAYRYVAGGRRYTFGQWPAGDDGLFHDGITTAPP